LEAVLLDLILLEIYKQYLKLYMNSETFCPKNREEWRNWLAEHHQTKQSIWLIYYKRKTALASISYSDAVEEALCFGWIDSTRRSLDEHTYTQFFCRRKLKSVWSKVNKAKVQRLIKEGLMTTAGFDSINSAKANGSWTILDNVEELIIPTELEAAFKRHEGSETYFLGLSKSVRKAILQWLVLAKRPETVEKRVDEIASLAAKSMKPKQF
jgi:uncharacterized protein YdeI (YjbR/CyaY-like superfamily)